VELHLPFARAEPVLQTILVGQAGHVRPFLPLSRRRCMSLTLYRDAHAMLQAQMPRPR
jgi:hypothetical protein